MTWTATTAIPATSVASSGWWRSCQGAAGCSRRPSLRQRRPLTFPILPRHINQLERGRAERIISEWRQVWAACYHQRGRVRVR